jgi:hypothetical protein
VTPADKRAQAVECSGENKLGVVFGDCEAPGLAVDCVFVSSPSRFFHSILSPLLDLILNRTIFFLNSFIRKIDISLW